jgi:predicted DNA-binding transcriptional regulator AlpA
MEFDGNERHNNIERARFYLWNLVQQKWDISRPTLRKMVKAQRVPSPVRLANKLFYDADALESRILATCRE